MISILKSILPQSANTPRWIIFVIDVSICTLSFLAAVTLRFNFFIGVNDIVSHFQPLPIVIGTRILFLLYFRTYAGIIRHTSLQDATKVMYAVSISSIIILIASISYGEYTGNKVLVPVSIIIIDFFFVSFLLNAFRLAVKIIYFRLSRPDEELITRYAIYGADESGIITRKKIETNGGGRFKVVAFFDDNSNKIGNYVDGVNIYDGGRNFAAILKKLKVKELIISPDIKSKSRKHEIIEASLDCGVGVKSVPPTNRWINGELSVNQIKGVKIEDLLDRDEIVLDKGAIAQRLFNKVVMITGAAGSIGSEIARQILANFNPKKVILVDKSEVRLYEIDNEFSINYRKNYDQVAEIVVADVCNHARMRNVFETFKPDFVYHAAAYKHVPIMEENPSEAIRVNVGGTKVVADLSVQYNVQKFVFVSTDKAVNPTNVMGASKRIAEMYVQSLNHSIVTNPKINTRFITTRFGNVLGSSGSVIPKFYKQIEEGGPVTVTHPDVTRFFMTIPEACQLVLEAGNMGAGGEIYIFDMGESVRIIDLAKKMIQLSGLKIGEDIQILYSGLRQGEKLNEELLANHENTIPTYHPKILIAKVRLFDYQWVKTEVELLIKLYDLQDNLKIVGKMKDIVPEFVSQNSVFESLDYINASDSLKSNA
jgi:FlaA1/EpsC-like NDP-sugar epimerase